MKTQMELAEDMSRAVRQRDAQAYTPESAPQWVRDVVENLQREHDKRVVEYIELERLLPTGNERAAIRAASTYGATAGSAVAATMRAYIERLAEASH